jgi:hypothetical protein
MRNRKASLLLGILGFLAWSCSNPAFAQEQERPYVVIQTPFGPATVATPEVEDVVHQAPDTPYTLRDVSPVPSFMQPSVDPYGTTNQIVNPYPVLNPNYVPRPFVVTPVVMTPVLPAPYVPSPLVPAVNVTPNGPWTPGYPVYQPILAPPPFATGPVAGPVIIVGP